MKTNITKRERVEGVHPDELPNGEYQGKWGGYEVTARIGSHNYIFRTEMGIRGFNVPCVVVVKDGEVSVHESAPAEKEQE